MIRRIAVAVLVLTAGIAVAAIMLRKPEQEWSTRSPQALEAFRRGLEAEMKLYMNEAEKHFRTALELDPAFLVAELKLSQRKMPDEKYRETLRERLAATDLAALTEREAFLARYTLASLHDDREERRRLLGEYLAKHPGDTYILSMQCDRQWGSGELEEAETCYRRLIRKDPNWVRAQNNLGYIAMAQGRFREAEEAFITYRYIAPDQANPHDSLGELLTLLGRYEEAERELLRALELRPDFCASWSHLVHLGIVQGDLAKARRWAARARAEAKCGEQQADALDRSIDVWEMYEQERWEELLERSAVPRDRYSGGDLVVIEHQAYLERGDLAAARALEERMAPPPEVKERGGLLAHLEGARLLHQRQYDQAVEKFRAADAQLVYRGDGEGFFKLYNRWLLAEALTSAGRSREAEAIVGEINQVNPLFARRLRK